MFSHFVVLDKKRPLHQILPDISCLYFFLSWNCLVRQINHFSPGPWIFQGLRALCRAHLEYVFTSPSIQFIFFLLTVIKGLFLCSVLQNLSQGNGRLGTLTGIQRTNTCSDGAESVLGFVRSYVSSARASNYRIFSYLPDFKSVAANPRVRRLFSSEAPKKKSEFYWAWTVFSSWLRVLQEV